MTTLSLRSVLSPPERTMDRERTKRTAEQMEAESDMTRPNLHDASKLSFPLQLVIAIVLSVVSATGAVWTTQRGNDSQMKDLQSDIRVALTQMSSAAEIAKLRDEATRTQLDSMKDEMKALKAASQLQQLQMQQLQLELAKGKH